MAESRTRAEVSTRTNAPDAWDAGLHADSDAGPIDVGLSVEPGAIGLIIEAPGVGRLKLAFDLKPDGSARLSRASRRLNDGRDENLVVVAPPPVAPDPTISAEAAEKLAQVENELHTAHAAQEALTLELEAARARVGELESSLAQTEERSHGRVSQISTERDDALAQIAALDDAAKHEAKARDLALATARTEHQELAAELEKLRAELTHAVAARAQAENDLQTAREGAAATPPTSETEAQLIVDLEAAYTTRTQLEGELEGLRATQAAEQEIATAARAQLEADLDALRTSSEAAQSQLNADLEIALTARSQIEAEFEALRTSSEAAQSQLAADLETALAVQTQLEAELIVARQEHGQLAAELANAKMSSTLPPEAEDELHRACLEQSREANARCEAFQAQLAAAEARMGAEAAATREARAVALKLQAERDEARTLARQLHLRLGAAKTSEASALSLEAERQISASLRTERDQLNLRLEALGRMIDQERDGRARALSERDEWRLRFKSLARGTVDTAQPLDVSREETRSYMIERNTVPEMPAADTKPTAPKKKGA